MAPFVFDGVIISEWILNSVVTVNKPFRSNYSNATLVLVLGVNLVMLNTLATKENS